VWTYVNIHDTLRVRSIYATFNSNPPIGVELAKVDPERAPKYK